MKKILNFLIKKERILLALVLCGLILFSTFEMGVSADNNYKIDYPVLDFTDIKSVYNFDGVDSYGNLEEDGWELTKDGHDYTLKLKDATVGKIVLPTDDADIDCFNSAKCGEDPRQSNVTVELYGNNVVYGHNSREDGIVGNYVKETKFTGDGNLRVDAVHGISIYSEVVFDGVDVEVNSHLYGINTNYSLTLNGGSYKIVSGDSSLISAEDMRLNKATIDAKISRVNDNYLAATEGTIESRRSLYIDGSNLTVRKGPNGIYAKDITINDSKIKDAGESALYTSIYASGGYDNGHTTNYAGNMTITNSNIALTGKEHALRAYGEMNVNGGEYDLTSTTSRTATVDAGTSFVLDGKANLSSVGNGYAVAVRSDKGTARFKNGTKVYLSAAVNSVADKYAVDQIAVSARKTYIEKNVEFEAFAGSQVFSYSPSLEKGAYYVETASIAEKNPKMLKLYIERKSREKVEMFHSSYRYVHVVPVVDNAKPVITGYVEGKEYCSLPTLTVTDDTGIDSITVNGKEIRDFVSESDTEKKFVVPISDSPIKDVVVTDVVGNKTTAKFTAYNGCAVDINGKVRLSYGETIVYDGKEKKPVVSVYYGTRKLKENADYKVTYSNNVNPGTATIKVTGMGGFTGTVTGTFTIEKQDNVISASNITKDYSTKDQTLYISATKKENAKLTYNSNNSNVLVDSNGKVTIKGGNTSSATITITASETAHYKKTTKNVVVTVKKLNNSVTASNVTKTYSSKDQTFTISAKQKGNAKLSYSSNNKSITVNSSGKVTIKKGYIGKATITITANESASYNKASTKITVTVNPATLQISKLSNVKGKKMTVKWSSDKNVTGYQVQYTTDSKFKKGVKTVTIRKNSTTSTTISKLTKGKKYYVRIRAYKTVSGTNYFSSWSKVKNVKISK